MRTFTTDGKRNDACAHDYQYGAGKSTIQNCVQNDGHPEGQTKMAKHCVVCGRIAPWMCSWSASGDDQHDFGIECWAEVTFARKERQ